MNFLRMAYNSKQGWNLVCDREFLFFSYMEIHLSAAEEKLAACADLGLVFSFGLIHNENSWQLHSGYWWP